MACQSARRSCGWKGERACGRIESVGGVMTTDWLQGVFPPIPTPFGEDGALALDRLRDNIARGTGPVSYTHLRAHET